MFKDSDFILIFGLTLIVVIILGVAFRFWEGKKQDELGKAILLFKINIFAVGFLSIVLWLMLPSTASFSTFGFPQTINDIESSKQLLYHLQKYNKVIARTTTVLHWFIFIFVWGFLTSLYAVIKVFSDLKEKKYFKKTTEDFSS